MVIPIYDSDPLDKNPWAVVTWSLIVINILVFAHRAQRIRIHGSGNDPRLCADPGRDLRPGDAGRKPAADPVSVHLHVSARGLVAHHRQHAVPVGARRQHRGRDGVGTIFLLLHAVRRGGRACASCDLSRLGRSADRRIRRRCGRGRRLSDAAPLRQDRGSQRSASFRCGLDQPGFLGSGRWCKFGTYSLPPKAIRHGGRTSADCWLARSWSCCCDARNSGCSSACGRVTLRTFTPPLPVEKQRWGSR